MPLPWVPTGLLGKKGQLVSFARSYISARTESERLLSMASLASSKSGVSSHAALQFVTPAIEISRIQQFVNTGYSKHHSRQATLAKPFVESLTSEIQRSDPVSAYQMSNPEQLQENDFSYLLRVQHAFDACVSGM